MLRDLSYPNGVIHTCKSILQKGGHAYAVGGSVRDALLCAGDPSDVDLEVYGLESKALERCLKSIGRVQYVGKAFGVYKLTLKDGVIDVALPRSEKKTGTGHRGFEAEVDPFLDFAKACSRRDLTINAIMHDPIGGEIIDPVSGLKDLESGILRHTSTAFGEDPLRALRVAQFASRLRFDVAESTLDLCRSIDIGELPKERIWGEFEKLLQGSLAPSWGLEILYKIQISRILPELDMLQKGDRLKTRLSLDQGAWRRHHFSNSRAMMLALLLYRLDPQDSPRTKGHSMVGRLTNEQKLIDETFKLLEHAGRLSAIFETRSSTGGEHALKKLSTKVDLVLLMEFERALTLGQVDAPDHDDASCWLRKRILELGLDRGPPDPFLKGRDLLDLGINPGPFFGRILQESYDLQLESVFLDREACLSWARDRTKIQEGLSD